jgi:hypothetical protein
VESKQERWDEIKSCHGLFGHVRPKFPVKKLDETKEAGTLAT